MPIDGVLRIIHHPKYHDIVDAVKRYIDNDEFAGDNFDIEFSNDYEYIKKIRRFEDLIINDNR